MPVLDIFNNDAFSAVEMTAAINIVPNDYGRLREMDLFPAEPIATTAVAVSFVNGTLNLLPTRTRGAPPSLAMPEKRSARMFKTFHIPHDDFVNADDVQNVLARTAEGGELEAVMSVVNRRLSTMRKKHSITLEHMRMGALKGQILDSDGSTLLNLFTEFGVTQKSVDFVLGTATTDVKAKAREVVGYIEDNLEGEVMSGVHVLASPEWFDDFIGHAKVEEIFRYYDAPNNPLRRDVRRGFEFHGLTIEEYRGKAQYLQENGTYASRAFIPTGEAIAFPVGTMDVFRTYFAPADFMDTVNTLGDEVYAVTAPDRDFNRFIKLHTQSNPLPIVKRPKLLVRLHTSN
ncbi:major capsid protein E [Acuticoccus sediminis]|uniref:Major capsid protein E n=1 Tax=Acuticoccus sediminis TaxID=2184697 RepID=A0A8B2NN69_9HYPH|nr:major capsid protein [Acuticoccus sediminis]RAI01107.1 major capsid protein E [Acuticoccus sediminis]